MKEIYYYFHNFCRPVGAMYLVFLIYGGFTPAYMLFCPLGILLSSSANGDRLPTEVETGLKPVSTIQPYGMHSPQTRINKMKIPIQSSFATISAAHEKSTIPLFEKSRAMTSPSTSPAISLSIPPMVENRKKHLRFLSKVLSRGGYDARIAERLRYSCFRT